MSIFSRLQRSIQNLPDDVKIQRQGLPNALNKMAKPEEIKFSGIAEALPADQTTFTKNDFLDAIHGRTDNMTSGQFSDSKFADVSLSPYHGSYFEDVTTMEGLDYKSSHFDEPGYLSHTRGYREDGITFLEEIQSDLHQDARKKGGYKGAPSKVPSDVQEMMSEVHRLSEIQDDAELNMTQPHHTVISQSNDLINKLEDLGYNQNFNGRYSEILEDTRPPEAPHKNTWLKKGIEKHMSEGDPIAVPIKGDVGNLQRGVGVQRWYEDKVPATLEKLARANNWDFEMSTVDANARPSKYSPEEQVSLPAELTQELTDAFLYDENSLPEIFDKLKKHGVSQDQIDYMSRAQSVNEVHENIGHVTGNSYHRPKFDDLTIDYIKGLTEESANTGNTVIPGMRDKLRDAGVTGDMLEDIDYGLLSPEEVEESLRKELSGTTYARITPNMGSNVKFEKYMAPAMATGVGAGFMMNPGEAEATSLDQITNKLPPSQDKDFFRNTLPADLEAMAALGTGAVLEPLAGLAGLVGTVLPGPQGQGADWVKNVQDMAYQPDDSTTLEQMGSALQYPLEMYEKGTNYLGDTALQHTGSPTIAALAKSSPEVLGGLFGIKQLMRGAK